MTNKETLEVTKIIFIPTPVRQVWRFLMDEEKMKTWLNADEFVIDMEDGGKIEFPLTFGEDEYLIIGEFSILLFEEKYTFIWRERDPFGEGRVYTVAFTAVYGERSCSHEVAVEVPLEEGRPAIDSGAAFNAAVGPANEEPVHQIFLPMTSRKN